MTLNKVILIGHSAKEPMVRYFSKTEVLASFSLATNEGGFLLSNGAEVPRRTVWHNVVAFGASAHFAEINIKQGSYLYIEGRLRYRSYEDKAGVQRFVTEIVADRLEFFTQTTEEPDRAVNPSTPIP